MGRYDTIIVTGDNFIKYTLLTHLNSIRNETIQGPLKNTKLKTNKRKSHIYLQVNGI